MRKLAIVAWVVLIGCAATQEGLFVPDARVADAEHPAPDAYVPLAPDAYVPPDAPVPPDAYVPPPPDAPLSPDAYVPPPPDAYVPPPPDAYVPPPPDAYVPPPPDACVPNPAGELCGNGIDDDCDGQVDEGFPQTGVVCTVGVGACARTGMTVCAPDRKSVTCSAEPGKPASIDLCKNGLDDDCDGQVDEDFPSWGTICYAGVGECKRAGLWVCNDAKDGIQCNAIPGAPATELCGTLHDENCDGNVDEGFPDLGQTCSVGVGHCKANGFKICDPADLTKTRCSAVANDPEPESCNGIDDNCNGAIDENDPGGGATCTTGSNGECGPGHLHCVEGRLACVPDHPPMPEVCDGKDNDCDGIIDNGFHIGQACDGPDLDFCARGKLQCATLYTTDCVGDTPTTLEVCNGLDDDCDGQVDENWNFFSDPDNCGGCNRVCSGLNVELRQCTSGACNPLCNAGYQSCDGNLANGCETLRNTYDGPLPTPTTTTASVKGDNPQAPVVLTGFGEQALRIQVREDSSGWENLHARFRLQNPDGVMMQLCIATWQACNGGWGESGCATLSGDQSIWTSADETPWTPWNCNDDTFDAYVEIRWISSERTACGSWTLTVYSEDPPQTGYPNLDADP